MSRKSLTFCLSGLIFTSLCPSPSGPTLSTITPPHLILLLHCNFDGDNLIPLFLHTEKMRLIRSSSSSSFLPPPRTSLAFFQIQSVLPLYTISKCQVVVRKCQMVVSKCQVVISNCQVTISKCQVAVSK